MTYDVIRDFFFSKPFEKNHRNRLPNTGNIFIAQVLEHFPKLECIVYSSGMAENVRMISLRTLVSVFYSFQFKIVNYVSFINVYIYTAIEMLNFKHLLKYSYRNLIKMVLY